MSPPFSVACVCVIHCGWRFQPPAHLAHRLLLVNSSTQHKNPGFPCSHHQIVSPATVLLVNLPAEAFPVGICSPQLTIRQHPASSAVTEPASASHPQSPISLGLWSPHHSKLSTVYSKKRPPLPPCPLMRPESNWLLNHKILKDWLMSNSKFNFIHELKSI